MSTSLSSSRPGRARGLATALALLVVAELAATVLLGRGLTGRPGVTDSPVPYGDLAVDVTITACGLLLARRRPGNPIGALLLAFAFLGATQNLGVAYGVRAYALPGEHLPLSGLALSLGASLWIPALFIPVTLLLVVYPDGTLPGPWWRGVNRVTVAAMAVTVVAVGTSPGATDSEFRGSRPVLALPHAAGLALGVAGGTLLTAAMLVCVAGALRRLWRAGFPQRQQLLWLVVTSAVLVAVAFLSPWEWLFDVALAMIPVAVAVGVLRYRMLGIEVVVRRTVLYAVLTGVVAAVYAAAAALGTLLAASAPVAAVAGAAAVAVLLVPVRDRLQRAVDRLVYGDRHDPLDAVRRVGAQLSADSGSLDAVAGALAVAVRASYAAILDGHGTVLARSGVPGTGPELRWPLAIGGAEVGCVVVVPARGEARLAAADEHTVEALCVPVAAAVGARRLNLELDAARERVVRATAAERSRLRRDLHDGLGPSLSGVALGLEATQASLVSDPDRAGEILRRLREEMSRAVDEVRRIIDALHPAALQDRPLLAAVGDRAASVSARHGNGLLVSVDDCGPLPHLAPAVEAAAYRIVDEAIANVVRHAGAKRCVVRVSAGTALTIEVADDGTWRDPADGYRGVGLRSMRQRAEDLGGAFEIRMTPSGSTVVATLPLGSR